ncbi:hypothetical protein DAI22_04g314000 [Oryza sativa Japonica Group]|nr:hypothetical protein DAI22_04g314000 [Oryza sativa Japonica Group]
MDNDCTCRSFRKGRRKTGFKVGKKNFRLCLRDERGTWICSEGYTMAKTTSLDREVSLLVQKRIAVVYHNMLKGLAMLTWTVYKKHRRSMNHLIDIINEKLSRYKDRRLKGGFFYLVPNKKTCDITVHSHMYNMPLQEALAKTREELKKREEILVKYNSSGTSNSARTIVSFASPMIKLLLSIMFSMILAYMIMVL